MFSKSAMAFAALTFAAAGLAGAPGAQAEGYPERPIEMIVPWGAGGGTDAVGRILASLMEADLGQPVSVVNRTGGSGVVGHSAIAMAEPDGYTIGVMTVEIAMMHNMGLTDLTYEDYDIIAMVNADPAGVMVAADSPYKTLDELLAAIKEKPPGTFTASGTGQGGIWNLALAGWMLSEDLPANQVRWVPSQGAAPALTDMVAGGVDIVTSSLAEGRALIEAGKVRPLATMSEERLDIFPDVPTLKEASGSDWTSAAWRSIAAPAGLPDDVRQTLIDAVDKAYHSDKYQSFMTERGFGLLWRAGDEATEFVAKADKNLGKVMKEAGLSRE